MPAIGKLLRDNRWLLAFALCFLLMRSALADWFYIPSSSMMPTVREGDRVLCNRVAYDLKLPFSNLVVARLGDPQRGDVVTFASPEDGVRLIKRVIAVPGDTVEMRDERLLVNAMQADYRPIAVRDEDELTPEYDGRQWLLRESIGERSRTILVMPDRPALRSFGPVTVPAGEYLMLGDNRDNSHDSRYIGLVRRELISGRVRHVLYSLDARHLYLPRLQRFGAAL